jgi:hypothetical protein
MPACVQHVVQHHVQSSAATFFCLAMLALLDAMLALLDCHAGTAC